MSNNDGRCSVGIHFGSSEVCFYSQEFHVIRSVVVGSSCEEPTPVNVNRLLLELCDSKGQAEQVHKAYVLDVLVCLLRNVQAQAELSTASCAVVCFPRYEEKAHSTIKEAAKLVGIRDVCIVCPWVACDFAYARSLPDKKRTVLYVGCDDGVDLKLFEVEDGVYEVLSESSLPCEGKANDMNGSELLASLVRQVRQSILACLGDTSTTRVDNVVLAGKASKMHGVSEMLQDLFGAHKVLESIDPEQLTALGAALQARRLCGTFLSCCNYFEQFDVLQVALGVKTAESITTIFPKNTVCPARKELWFRARHANNKVVVVEGEHASTCRKLYSFVVQSTQGLDEDMLVRIVFELSAQQKLSVAIYQTWSDSETTFVCDLSLGDDQESPDLEPVQLVDMPGILRATSSTTSKATQLVEQVEDVE